MLFARSHLAHELASFGEVMWKRIVGQPVFSFERRGDFYLAWKPYGWKWVRDLIGEMHSLLQAKGISLVVLVFPVTDQVIESYRNADEAYVLYPQYRIREICDDYGIPILDLTETLYSNGGRTLSKDYLHLNGEGNSVVANALESYLADNLPVLNGTGKLDLSEVCHLPDRASTYIGETLLPDKSWS